MAIYLNISINCLSNINCNYMINFDYHDNLLKRIRNLKFKIVSCTQRKQENNIMQNNNSQKNMDHFEKE